MKSYLLLFLLIFISCKDGKDSTDENLKALDETNLMVETDTLFHDEEFLRKDTLVFEKLKKINVFDKVVATTLKKVYTKDSIEVTQCRLDFYRENEIISSIPITASTSEEGIWSLYEDLFPDEKREVFDNRFFEISYGYPACGYTQSNFLFFTENNKLQLISKYDSSGDGPYGDLLEFEPKFVGNKIVSLSSKKVQIDSDESKPYNEENENLIRVFSDSVAYTYNSGKWTAKPKTPKGKIFRKEYKTYKELYEQE